jgi:8-oxo-dGTP diphosphatase
MVDASAPSAKNPDAAPVWLPVVAGALITPAGKCLMHQRPQGKMYAGLWEFPGGKVEASEKPVDSLVRELAEELGIAVPPTACRPALLAQQEPRAGLPAIVLMLYTIDRWDGTPAPLEGGAIGWFAPHEALGLALAPMDRDLAGRLWPDALAPG